VQVSGSKPERTLAIAIGWGEDYVILTGVNANRSRARTTAFSRTEEEEHDAMHTIDIQDYARQLLEAHGFHAIAEAAQKARTFEEQGEKEQAETWRSIEQALMLMRGPNES
jgi:hypothetical protein